MNVGQEASIPCQYRGSTDLSIWAINLSLFVTHFPLRYSRDGYNLTIHDVQDIDNGTSYQCIVFDKRSRVAILTVRGNIKLLVTVAVICSRSLS